MAFVAHLLARSKLAIVPVAAAAVTAVAGWSTVYTAARVSSSAVLGTKTKDLDFTASAAAGAGAVVPTATYILFREMFQKPRDWRSIRDGIAAKELKKVAPGAATESYSFTHTLRALKVPAKYYAVTLLASAAIAGTGASVSQRMAVGADARPKPKPKAKPAAESKAVAPAAPAHAPAAVAPAAAATHDSASEAHHEPAHSASPAPAGDSHAKH